MPHAALWVVQPEEATVFSQSGLGVSMPHAALWVVQQTCLDALDVRILGFNAARGFVGGAARER